MSSSKSMKYFLPAGLLMTYILTKSHASPCSLKLSCSVVLISRLSSPTQYIAICDLRYYSV